MSPREPVLGAAPFELTGPLPAGPTTTVLEASAGTGKTYAIVGLLARYVAEGVAELGEMLLITFSRAATQELRERARSRLLSVERALRDPAAAAASDDELIRHLATGDAAEVAVRHRRLVTALSDFDAATITTTHGFCQRMLDALGLAGDLEPGAVFVEDVDDLVQEVAEDVYLGMFAGRERAPFPLPDALIYARTVVANPRAAITPAEAEPGSDTGLRVEYARIVRREVDRRKRMGRLRDYDDLQGLLRDALTDLVHGHRARARLQALYSVVLVDEFQDTDPVQWDILHDAFHGASTLVLVGDPKQAIYAFRGAEVTSYLRAVRLDGTVKRELDVNRRSDAPLVRALQHLYGDVAFGDPLIVAGSVEAHRATSRLAGGAPLRLRYLGSNGVGPKTQSGIPYVRNVRPVVLRDVAADITRTLTAGEQLETAPGESRALRPGDVAVLVRKNAHVAELQSLLQEYDVPAVAAGGASVFTTAAAVDWLRVLQALENPGRSDRARLAALTPLFEFTARDLDERGDELVSAISGRLRTLAGIFARSGFAAMFDALATRSRFDERLLGRAGGERMLTDLRHVAELVQHATVTLGLGLAAATRWLADRIADPGLGGTADPARRLATDTAAVQLMTVHASKGLQFPVVYLPFGWDDGSFGGKKTFVFHDQKGDRLIDVGGEYAPGFAERYAVSQQEAAGEELRLLYVGATRAQSRLVLWWAPGTTTRSSPLHRLLFSDVGGGRVPAAQAPIPRDADVGPKLREWAAPIAAAVSIEAVDLAAPRPAAWRPQDVAYPALELARASRRIDPTWRRTSYSALVADAAHGPAEAAPDTGSEPEQPATDDEPTEEPMDAPADAGGAPSSRMNGLSGGAVFGTLVHEILEHVDTGAPDLAAEVLTRCREAAEYGATADDPEEVAAALVAVLHTPLGTGDLAHLTLAEVAPGDHLAELDFELPLGGDGPAATLSTIADLLDEHLPPGDPLAPYAERLREVPGAALRGYLTGSIDSVLRIATPDGPRFTVVDYKTNRLARGDLTTADYTAEAMAREMISSHYVLQALLYSVALHRFLSWRVPGYAPRTHLGVVQYHFVRAMIGPETPPGAGVFEWHPPAELVVEVSDALAGGTR
ncbi:UvrD-helicase domain-containing protein [Tsukamurella paurometabola]|uniref:RecBCD enzyme subunit RecB n=1 Tax=Tsukamurella paurometabola TaxID=2061 RepID=A0A3P8MEQ4_TSUPA|nr:UvrD-helicase domain-containing protein [Tsukamurella paurometabola]UEA83491.1 UvrD-helicase domain-containing protein [Tsukamurella paurometabola]VDR40613.1 Exodeoxyribonuclease V beta chain [Tsukamurella paurometabola]